MASSNGDHPDGSASYYEGYSDYRSVSNQICRSVDAAMDAYAGIQRMHQEGVKVQPDEAAQAGQQILSAALRLLTELRQEREKDKVYDDILIRWLDDKNHTAVENPSEYDIPRGGYIEALMDARLLAESPDWLKQMVIDIRDAGWHLGYLQAGRREEGEPDDPVEADAQAMFE